eukprot:TRINITY_DN2712_c0_g1_i10.p4 TRINITY_DN2712_c0_g1~~TRINITY_DN2712_c0_g1_i10.p4  ORF type:complete len:103 (+),score=46.45 TRINITY_DN2712_c0_g1_i10:62-370(+)
MRSDEGCQILVFFFFFSSRRRHTRCREVSWARRCVQETGYQRRVHGNIALEMLKKSHPPYILYFSDVPQEYNQKEFAAFLIFQRQKLNILISTRSILSLSIL